MATPTWETHELPILEAIAERAASIGGPRWEELVELVGLPADQVQLALRRLYENDYIDGIDVTSMGDAGFELLDIKLLEPALRIVGIWPREPYEEFLRALERRIGDETDPERRSRLERLRDALIQMGESVATSVLTEVVKRSVGL